jgi:signal transduction histidine kinase/CheY-like chemotaxis protein
LSFSALCLGCYTFYTGRRAAKIKWEYLFLTLDAVLLSLGMAWIMEEWSPAFTLLGATLSEIALILIFPLITLYLAAIDKRLRSFFHKFLIFQVLFAAALIFFILQGNYWEWETEFSGKIELAHIKNPAFYLALGFSVLSLLLNIGMILQIHNKADFKRDRMQGAFWVGSLALGAIFMVIRFYFSAANKYGCFFQFFLIVLAYFHSQRYNTATLTLFNVASYVYSLVKTPLLVVDEKGRVLLTNNSALLFFGKNPGELADVPMGELFDFGGPVSLFSKTPGPGNRMDKFEALCRHNNIWCEVEATYIYDRYQEFLYAIFIIYDMTGIKNLVNELEEEKQRAELASQAKSAFLATTSHEIRTPMNAIIGLSELILREEVSAEVYEYAMNIRQAGANLLSLINDILDFSKIESGKLELTPIRYHFRSLINDVINIIRMRVIEKSLAFVTDIDPLLPNSLVGDEARVRQILLNLLSNAVKYTEKGFIRLTVSAEKNRPHDGADRLILNIAVEDSGIGIKPEDMDKVFGEFVQVNMAANRGIEGSGLGLAITKGLCRAMGGDVTVASTYGAGSVFTARIPQEERSGEPVAAVEDPEKKPVLVYEDRPIYAESLRLSLKKLGVPHALVNTPEAFSEALLRGIVLAEGGPLREYRFVLIAYNNYEGIRAFLETRERKPQTVLLVDYGAELRIPSCGILTLPAHVFSLADILNQREKARNALEKGRAAASFTAPSARILVVDDIATNLKVAQGLMAPYHMTIDACQSGFQGIELIKENRYDLVFMDHMMPEMDGIETVRIIRLLEDPENYFQTLPIIALTANVLSGIKEMFLNEGFSDYLAKPIEMPKLDRILEQWIPWEKQVKAGGPFPEESSSQASAGSAPGVSREKPVFPPFGEKLIEGIDFAAGLKQYKEEAVYREALCAYRSFVPGLLDTLRGVSPDRLEAYASAIHDLKSVSYRIYADRIGRQAEALECAAKAGDWETLQGRNGHFVTALETLLGDLGGVLGA